MRRSIGETAQLRKERASAYPRLSPSDGRTSAGPPASKGRHVTLFSERGAVGRVYEDVKNRILSGEIRLRERLDVDHLARMYRVSGTPVRQALSHLAFERLIVPHPTRGFHVALWSERGLHDLYEWRGMLACMAAASFERAAPAKILNGASVYADRITTVLQCLNKLVNCELGRAAINADERLRAARLVEPDLFPDCEGEAASIAAALATGTEDELQSSLRSYHLKRAERAGEIRARALLRALPEDED
jgi:hypothetical protein